MRAPCAGCRRSGAQHGGRSGRGRHATARAPVNSTAATTRTVWRTPVPPRPSQGRAARETTCCVLLWAYRGPSALFLTAGHCSSVPKTRLRPPSAEIESDPASLRTRSRPTASQQDASTARELCEDGGLRPRGLAHPGWRCALPGSLGRAPIRWGCAMCQGLPRAGAAVRPRQAAPFDRPHVVQCAPRHPPPPPPPLLPRRRHAPGRSCCSQRHPAAERPSARRCLWPRERGPG